MDVMAFLWGVVSGLPISAAIAIEFAIIVTGGLYIMRRIDAVQKSVAKLTDEFEDSREVYAKVSELALVRTEMSNLAQQISSNSAQMTTGFQAINSQLTTISAAIINASRK